MEYFKKYFNEVENWDVEEVKVRCPFHLDQHPSASINTEKGLFHCWVCEVGYNEEQFVARINNISTGQAFKLLEKYNIRNTWNLEKGQLWADDDMLKRLELLGYDKELIEGMQLGEIRSEDSTRRFLGIPVFYNNMLVDVRRYNIMKYSNCPKVQSNEGAINGWLIPYDKFISSNDTCYFFEGEKDMLMARKQGINGYTMISGAGAIPNEYVINSFKDKDIVLCYDNDEPGKKGMLGMYKQLKDIVKSIKYINISDVVRGEKEDFYDYITKYNGNLIEFYSLEQHHFNLEEDEDKNKITIKEALRSNSIRKNLRSVITVTSEFSDSYSVPTMVTFTKDYDTSGKSSEMIKGETRNWFLEDKNICDMLQLIELNAKNVEVLNKLKNFAGVNPKEPAISVKIKEPITVYKSIVIDKDNDGSSNTSIDLYSFEKLDVGSQYIIDYKIFPHPTKNQKLVAICTSSTPTHDTKAYQLNKNLLSKFRISGTVEQRLDYLYQSAKHYVAKHLKYDTWLMTDLVFNSILDFEYDRVIRGALDVFFLGDTQVGKSETTSKISELYNFGHFLSLKTSTTVGLIGGSNKVDGSYCNTIGAIPRQHKRLAILEEFSGADPNFIKTMTDIRSSNELRISRASGELKVPCKLRMITISNPINDDNGNPRFLNTFPNGVMPLMELIKSAEDVARYDGFLLIPRVEKRINPFENELKGEVIPKGCYEEKSNWVVTRKVENVRFEEGVKNYIWEKAEELNKLFECNFPLFGTTTNQKLARFCVAMSSLLMNVSDDYENVIVTKDIVDYTVEWLKSIYNNNIFRLRDYAMDYRSYSNYTPSDINNLQSIYTNNSTLIDFISTQNKTTRSNLMSISGCEVAKFAAIFNKLVGSKFIRLSGDTVYPTDKFRKVYNIINKEFRTDLGNKVENSNGLDYIEGLGE